MAITVPASGDDLVIDGVYEAAIDLPRINFLLKHEANEPPIEIDGNFELNYAFLDTGASGILLSRETAETMGISNEPCATFVDVGVGGEEYFNISQSLYVGTADYNSNDPYDPNVYSLSGPWRFQVRQNYADIEAIDVLGIPVMAGKTVVLDSGATNDFGYFSADIKEANDPAIPDVDFKVPLRFERYITPEDTRNIPPLPVLAYNPVIDNVTIEYNSTTSGGTWLLDTGAMYSMISVGQAAALGLTDSNGMPLVTPDFYTTVGGVGSEVEIPGFKIDKLTVPTLCGYNLVFSNARVCVLDVGIYDYDADEFVILDGIFGSNFLCATINLESFDMAGTAFDRIVIDTRNALLGFDVNSEYTLPTCNYSGMPWPKGDFNRNGDVEWQDLEIFTDEWLRNCDWLNWNCRGADSNNDHIVNSKDFADFAENW